MLSLSLKKVAVAVLAVAGLCASGAASAAGTAEVFNQAIIGSVDYGFMGYTDENGNFVSVVGQKILGAWAEVDFDPAMRRDFKLFTMQMVVPVEGAKSQFFKVDASQLIPTGHGKYRAMVSSNLFNGTVVAGRYSIEVFGTNLKGEQVPLDGKLTESGFHFIVTRPD